MTSSRSGMPLTSSAPVESTIRSSSGRNGSEDASEPAAMMQCSKPTTVSPTLIGVGARELAGAAHDLDLALLGQRLQAAGEAPDDAVLPGADLVDVDRGRLEADARLAELRRPRSGPSRRAAAPSTGCSRRSGRRRRAARRGRSARRSARGRRRGTPPCSRPGRRRARPPGPARRRRGRAPRASRPPPRAPSAPRPARPAHRWPAWTPPRPPRPRASAAPSPRRPCRRPRP